MSKFILINGPRRSGKDTARKFIDGMFPNGEVGYYRMGAVMRNGLNAMFDVPGARFHQLYETQKEDPSEEFFGLSGRDAQIELFSWLQKTFGDEILGMLAVRRMYRTGVAPITVIDVGRRSECIPIVRTFGRDNILLLRLARHGCVYNDGRECVDLSDVGVKHVDIDNKYDIELYEAQVTNAVGAFLNVDPRRAKPD